MMFSSGRGADCQKGSWGRLGHQEPTVVERYATQSAGFAVVASDVSVRVRQLPGRPLRPSRPRGVRRRDAEDGARDDADHGVEKTTDDGKAAAGAGDPQGAAGVRGRRPRCRTRQRHTDQHQTTDDGGDNASCDESRYVGETGGP
jgi:hypothetical protein